MASHIEELIPNESLKVPVTNAKIIARNKPNTPIKSVRHFIASQYLRKESSTMASLVIKDSFVVLSKYSSTRMLPKSRTSLLPSRVDLLFQFEGASNLPLICLSLSKEF